MKNCKNEQKTFILLRFFAFLTSKSEKATAGHGRTRTDTETIILRILLGNRNWSRARRPPARRPLARTHERNETISRLGTLALSHPNLRFRISSQDFDAI